MKTAKRLDPTDSDPNYLLEQHFEADPWHNALKRFRDRCRSAGVPPLHIDFHGKMNPKKDPADCYTLDLGIDPMLSCCRDKAGTGATAMEWSRDEAASLRTGAQEALQVALGEAGVGTKSRGVRVDPDPYLCGLWGHGCEHTLSHQAVRLGVPAFQLETPKVLRTHLMRDDELLDRLADAVVSVYHNVVVPIEAAKSPVSDVDALGPPTASHSAQLIDRMLGDIAYLDALDRDPQI